MMDDQHQKVAASFRQRFKNIGVWIFNQKLFPGVGLVAFEEQSRDQFIALLENGLTPESQVLDIGCGCLRCGSWLIHFLNAGKYYGVEPNKRQLNAGLKAFGVIFDFESKKPQFINDDSFKFPFPSKIPLFDYFTACSVWTHASKDHISTMLDRFVDLSNENGKFVTTFIQPDEQHEDYKGTEWIGCSHTSRTPGIAAHSMDFIEQQCKTRNLKLKIMGPKTYFARQIWISIEK